MKIMAGMIGLHTQGTPPPTELRDERAELTAQLDEPWAKLRELKEQCKRLEQARADDQRELEDLRDHVSKVAEHRDMYERRCEELIGQVHDAQAESHELRKALQNAEADKHKLQDQVAEFKKIVSFSSQVGDQVADDVIRTKSEQIFYDIQAFVVQNFKKVSFGKYIQSRCSALGIYVLTGPMADFSRVTDNTKQNMQHFAPLASQSPKSAWLNIINSLIAQIMVDSFKPRNFFGVTNKIPVVGAKEIITAFGGRFRLSGAPRCEADFTLTANTDSKWALATRKLLNDKAKAVLDMSDQQLAQNLAKRVFQDLQPAVSVECTPKMQEKLVEIFKRAQEFYRLVYGQQSQLKMVLPMAGGRGGPRTFVPDMMEVVNGGMDDEDALAGTPIEIAVSPGMFKAGGPCWVDVSIAFFAFVLYAVLADIYRTGSSCHRCGKGEGRPSWRLLRQRGWTVCKDERQGPCCIEAK